MKKSAADKAALFVFLGALFWRLMCRRRTWELSGWFCTDGWYFRNVLRTSVTPSAVTDDAFRGYHY